METLKPLLELLVLFIVFSAVVERCTEVLKFRVKDLLVSSNSEQTEKERVYDITWRSVVVGIFLAMLVKANVFEMVILPENVWRTLGWLRVDTDPWAPAAAAANLGTVAYALGGSILSGLGFSLGSKFWHDLLGIVEEYRRLVRSRREGKVTP